MVWVREQIKTKSSSSGFPNLALDTAATAGNLIVVCLTSRASAGNISAQSGYTEAVEGNDNALIAIYYKVAAGGEVDIDPVVSVEDNWALFAAEYSGNGSGDPLDQADYNGSGNSNVNNIDAGPTGTLAEATELGIVMSAHQGTDDDVHTWDNGYSLVVEFGSGGGGSSTQAFQSIGEQFDVGTAAEESHATWSRSRRSAGAIVTFKAAAAAADVYPPFPRRQNRRVRM